MNFVKEVKRRIRSWMGLPVSQAPSDKAAGGDFLGRFREVVSDPLNLLIERDPRAGMVEGGLVWLHNGNRVPFEGKKAYYGRNSELLMINRGVHEPLKNMSSRNSCGLCLRSQLCSNWGPIGVTIPCG